MQTRACIYIVAWAYTHTQTHTRVALLRGVECQASSRSNDSRYYSAESLANLPNRVDSVHARPTLRRLHQWRNWLTHRRFNFENNRVTQGRRFQPKRFIEARGGGEGGRRKGCVNKAFESVFQRERLPDTDYKMEVVKKFVRTLYKDKPVEVKWRQMWLQHHGPVKIAQSRLVTYAA